VALRPQKLLPALTVLLSFGLFSNLADAAGKKDKDAQKLISQAMDDDYLNVEFDKAEAKLKKALDTCGASNCSPEVLAKIHVALATVHGVGEQKLDVAKSDLVNALKADPNVKLIDGLSTPELEAKLKEAQAETGGSTGEGGSSEGGASTGGSSGSGTPAPQGDFTHEPVPEQEVHYPVPVFAAIPEEIGVTKVVVRYKAYGGTKWETLALEKMDGGFGGEFPCDASSSSGDLKYYIIGSDESGTPVATAGSLKAPFKVPIRSKVEGDKASLPGKPAPKRCIVKEDCPPGLPGCEGASGGKPEGGICDENAECASGLACLNGECTPTDEETPSGPGKHSVISAGVQFDLAYIGDGANVCSGGKMPDSDAAWTSPANYVCTYADSNEQFRGDPRLVKGTNGISGGLGLGGIRFLAGYDYFFDFGLGLGARVGFALGGPSLDDSISTHKEEQKQGYPTGSSFLPVHAEARASWRFLHPTMQGGDFAPHVFVGGGIAQVNASVPVTVCNSTAAEAGDNAKCYGETKVSAYQLTGLSFASFGGGATYMFIDNFGVSLDLKFMVMFPTVGFVIAPSLSPVVSF